MTYDDDMNEEHLQMMLRLDLADMLDKRFGHGDTRVYSGDDIIWDILSRFDLEEEMRNG